MLWWAGRLMCSLVLEREKIFSSAKCFVRLMPLHMPGQVRPSAHSPSNSQHVLTSRAKCYSHRVVHCAIVCLFRSHAAAAAVGYVEVHSSFEVHSANLDVTSLRAYRFVHIASCTGPSSTNLKAMLTGRNRSMSSKTRVSRRNSYLLHVTIAFTSRLAPCISRLFAPLEAGPW